MRDWRAIALCAALFLGTAAVLWAWYPTPIAGPAPDHGVYVPLTAHHR